MCLTGAQAISQPLLAIDLACHDVLQATRLARQMVTKYGMSSAVGQISLDYEDDGRSISSETRAVIEHEVRQ